MFSELAQWLFDPSGLTPHGFDLLWEPALIWLYAVSDAGMGLAFFSIPFALAVILRKRPDLVVRPVFALSAGFIFLCGAGHWLDLVTLWIPAYGLEGLVKAATAIVSIVAAIVIWRLLPQALALPSPAQLRLAHAELAAVHQAELRAEAKAVEAAEARDAHAAEMSYHAETYAALRTSEERLRLLMQSDLAEAFYLMDADGFIETWNASASRIEGFEPDEVIGRHFSMFYTAEDVAAREPERVLAIARATGRFAGDGWRVRKDGQRFLASVALDAVYRDDGTLRGFVKVTIDLTKRRIEEAQRAILFNRAPNGLMIVDEAGVITLANAQVERIFGYPAATLPGQPVEVLVPDNSRPTLHDAFAEVRGPDGGPAQRVLIGRKSDGRPVTVEVMLSPVETPRGSIVVVSTIDVTDRIREANERMEAERRERETVERANADLDRLARHLATARDRAEQANRAKSRFLAGMSHELRTPLNAILGYAQLLHGDAGLTDLQAARIQKMLTAGHHLLDMITSALDLSEIEADHVTLRPVAVGIRSMAEACIELVRPAADGKGLWLNLTVAPGTPPELNVDPTRFRQVLLNLLGNAVKFTGRGGVEVRLGPAVDARMLRIEVVDTGPGVSAAHRNRLFQDFERLEASATIEGAGLGLALSSRLTELMGGRLGYDDNPGGGSIFWLEMPQVAGGAAAADEPGSVGAPERALRVLVVDDVSTNRDIAEAFLQAGGHEVTAVASGEEAVSIAGTTDFDVVLMDVRMPGIDGLEATRRIRALGGARGRVPIVALTAHAFAEQVRHCREAGMDGHVPKPFSPDMLLAAVSDAARRTPAPPPAQAVSDAASGPFSGAADAARRATAELPTFDAAVFARTSSTLGPAAVATYMRTIAGAADSLLEQLRDPRGLAEHERAAAAAAHRLAGSAGMFGFTKLAAVALDFEYAVETKSAAQPAVARRLCEVIDAAREDIADRTPARVAHPPYA